MKYLQGDIVIVPFPFSDQSDSKVRPAVIVSGSTLNKTNDVILAMITSNTNVNNFVFSFDKNDIEKPLDFASAVRCDKLVIADKMLIRKKISKFHKKSIEAIVKKVRMVFD